MTNSKTKVCQTIKQNRAKLINGSDMVHQVNIAGVFASIDSIGFSLSWIATEGYGELRIEYTDDGDWYIDSEHMSKEFVMEVLKKLVDDAKLID